MKHKDISVEISLRRFVSLSDFVPEPMFQVNITNPAGKDTAVMFWELSDALHLVARVFSPKVTEEEKVTKVTKRNRSKNPKGFMDDWVLKMLKKNPMTLHDLVVASQGKVEGRGLASILRSLKNRGLIFTIRKGDTVRWDLVGKGVE